MVALVVGKEKMVLKYSEEVDCTHLFLELRAVVEYYVLAVSGQSHE
jgi:hypothetical protein